MSQVFEANNPTAKEGQKFFFVGDVVVSPYSDRYLVMSRDFSVAVSAEKLEDALAKYSEEKNKVTLP